MTQSQNSPPSPPAGQRSLIVIIALILVLGLGLGMVGFLAGRATAPTVTVGATTEPVPVAAVSAEYDPADELAAIEDGLAVEPAQILESPTPQPEPTATSTAMPAIVEPTSPPPPTPTPETVIIPALPAGGSPLDEADLSTLYEIWSLITDQFDGEVPESREVIESAIAGSLETLGDTYTRYVSPEVAQRMREDMQGAVEGIGAFVRENEDGLFEIVRPIDGQPAALAGLKPGDILQAVDGESVLGLSFDEVILLVRGPRGTPVTLSISREGEEEPLEFTVVRTRFEVPVVEAEMLPEDITGGAPVAYLRLTEFNRNAEQRLLEALDDLLAQQPAGLILDLRDNPGGFLDQSVSVADAFLPQGVVLFERNIRGLDETFSSFDGDVAEGIPLVVLVNAGSASASEIVAGAIQDRGRAILVGETTFGKGSVQQIYPLSDGSELRVTIARWYTPNNHSIDGQGITPDIEVESPDTLGGVEDAQLRRAVDYLLTGQ
jgi:carboxyl-terminal processing protease